jgi:hypothetical protein
MCNRIAEAFPTLLAHVRPLIEIRVTRVRLDTDKPHLPVALGAHWRARCGRRRCFGTGTGHAALHSDARMVSPYSQSVTTGDHLPFPRFLNGQTTDLFRTIRRGYVKFARGEIVLGRSSIRLVRNRVAGRPGSLFGSSGWRTIFIQAR